MEFFGLQEKYEWIDNALIESLLLSRRFSLTNGWDNVSYPASVLLRRALKRWPASEAMAGVYAGRDSLYLGTYLGTQVHVHLHRCRGTAASGTVRPLRTDFAAPDETRRDLTPGGLQTITLACTDDDADVMVRVGVYT